MTTIVEAVRRAARARVLYLPHAVKQMARPDRLVTPEEVECRVSGYHYRVPSGALPMEPGLPSEDRLMECLHCKGRMERGTAPFSVDRHGYHVRWDAIAAEQIERALEVLDRANEQLATAV